MGAVDLVIQVEAPPSVASGLQRIGRAGHQVGEISQGVLFPKHRTDLIGCAVTVQRMLAGEIETMRVPTNPLDVLAQHTVAAVRAGTAGRRPLVRRGAAQRAVRDAAAQRVRGDAGPAVRQVPVDRVRRAAAAAGVRPRRGHADRAARCAAAGGHLRRRHPRPRPVHRLPGDRLRKALAGRRTRRGDGLRVAARRRDLAGCDQLADHRDHPRPGAGHPGARPAGAAAVLARRRRGPARRTGRRRRRVHRRAGAAGPRRVRRALPRNGFRRLRDRQPVAAARRPASGHRHRAQRHHVRGGAVPRRARRLAGDPALPLRTAGARPAGAGGLATAAGALRHRREADGLRRRHHRAAARHRRHRARAPTCSCSTPTRSNPSSPPRSAARRCSRRGSANARPAHCFCRAGIPASGRRCGISGSAPRSCSTSPASTRISRSCWRRCANACRTSTTCPR